MHRAILPWLSLWIYVALGTAVVFTAASPARAEPGREATEAAFVVPEPTGSLDFLGYANACGQITRWIASQSKVQRATLHKCVEYAPVIQYCEDPLKSSPPDSADVVVIADHLNQMDDDDSFTCKTIEALKKDYKGEIGFAGAIPLSFGSDFQQQAVQALSAFLVKRARAEALDWSSQRLGVELCATTSESEAGGTALFPSVCGILLASTSSSAPPTSWGAVRQAAVTDLRQLPLRLLPHVLDHIAKDGSPELRSVVTDAAVVFGVSWNVTNAALSGEGVLEVIAAVEPYVEGIANAEKGKLRDWLVLLGALSAESRAKIYESLSGTASPWIPTEVELKHLSAVVLTHLSDSSPVVAVVKTDQGQRRLRVLLADLTELAARGKRAQAEGASDDAMIQLLESLSQVIEDVAQLAREQQGQTIDPGCSGKTPDPAGCALVVIDHAELLVSVAGSMRRNQYGAALAQLFAWWEPSLGSDRLPSWLRGWGPFLADLASAEDVETMQGVLESLAAPVGSYKVKRGSVFRSGPKPTKAERDQSTWKTRSDARKQARKDGASNWHAMINAYVGVQSGGEVLLGDGGWAGHLGPTASIGAEIGGGIGRNSSLGLYVPILDVGGLADFRLGGSEAKEPSSDDEKVESTAQPGVAQVFAPGAYLVFGLGRSPVALGLGVQLAPALRRTQSDAGGRDFTVLQAGGFLAIDIPVWVFR